MTLAFVGIGSNVDPERNVARAVAELARAGELRRASTFHRTPAVGGGPDFVNGVVSIEPADATPDAFRARLAAIEARLGRVRVADKNAPRTIDLDLLLWEGRPEPPHEDVARYPFVAHALAEVTDGARGARAAEDEVRAWVPLRELTERARALATGAPMARLPASRSPSTPSRAGPTRAR